MQLSDSSSGGDSGGETPLPIPNRVVKPFCADGTAWVTLWESRALPGDLKRRPDVYLGAFSVFICVLLLLSLFPIFENLDRAPHLYYYITVLKLII